MNTWIAIGSASLLVACGGSSFSEQAGAGGSSGSGGSGAVAGAGGSGGNGGSGGAAGSGGTAGVPDECRVETSRPAPHAVRFVFISQNAQYPSYLLEDCRLRFEVTSCSDGYTQPLATSAECSAECGSENGCVVCGACPIGTAVVTPGNPTEYSWNGNSFTFGTDASGCDCHNTASAPPGKYRISIPVYPTSEPYSGEPASQAAVEFSLPAPDDTVVVDVSIPWEID